MSKTAHPTQVQGHQPLVSPNPTTRALLACGLVAGPLYLVVGFAQAFLRPGFDAAHNDLSVLANGDLGWIQIANLVLTGILTLLCSIGIRRSLHPGRGGTWGPLLIGLYGAGLIGAGIFIADPMNGFPPGTSPGHATAGSVHGFLHFVTGGLGFIGLIAGCFVLSRRFFATGNRGLGAFSIITGTVFVAAFIGIASGSTSAVIVLGFTAAVVLAWIWLAVTAAHLLQATHRQADPGRGQVVAK
ncbi:DUF998 domain-containing protein [Paenarthrobacter sp. PH39-S1]|uniref:DUF998 domain-containing protein n=1 Tax=Paenarthrobacter sp. PH39-S1 TaxID=3046204 RepID=UPI0024BA6A5E|nr:DUF998 domain-containing protein [Paenarthrobacter sp. PH39-S1]MDJ0356650.1 DUF998 domain-containing protein [Paenarthrobacter sp. PH39-S1]